MKTTCSSYQIKSGKYWAGYTSDYQYIRLHIYLLAQPPRVNMTHINKIYMTAHECYISVITRASSQLTDSLLLPTVLNIAQTKRYMKR